MRRALGLLAAAAVAAAPLPALASRGHAVKKRAHARLGTAHVTDLMRHPSPAKPPLTTPPPSPTTQPPSYPTTRLSVSAREFSLTFSTNPVAAGDALVELDNTGEDSHNLIVVPAAGGGRPLAVFPETQPGQRSKKRFKLSAGTYEVYCTLLDHRERGMDALLTVR